MSVRVPLKKLDVFKRLEAGTAKQSMEMAEELQRRQMFYVVHGYRTLSRGLIQIRFCLH